MSVPKNYIVSKHVHGNEAKVTHELDVYIQFTDGTTQNIDVDDIVSSNDFLDPHGLAMRIIECAANTIGEEFDIENMLTSEMSDRYFYQVVSTNKKCSLNILIRDKSNNGTLNIPPQSTKPQVEHKSDLSDKPIDSCGSQILIATAVVIVAAILWIALGSSCSCSESSGEKKKERAIIFEWGHLSCTAPAFVHKEDAIKYNELLTSKDFQTADKFSFICEKLGKAKRISSYQEIYIEDKDSWNGVKKIRVKGEISSYFIPYIEIIKK